ncbi:hypothetical protein Rhow_005067 [Rhodococcus wratislaviensis]|uniref:Uncharacterized protein n=1 Tax=Rhodococcus wratislaviensis TaxID=44752 RepID=A0A402CCS5_RHOWR|nr:hypothetical protein Rhow_005067 [Rhodococcus wratislaviensis]
MQHAPIQSGPTDSGRSPCSGTVTLDDIPPMNEVAAVHAGIDRDRCRS